MNIFISVVIILLLMYLIKQTRKLNNIYNSFDDLMVKFIEVNQTYYKEQNNVLLKLKEYIDKEKKIMSNMFSMKKLLDIVEKSNMSMLDNINILKQHNDRSETNNKLGKQHNNVLKSKISTLDSTIKKVNILLLKYKKD